MEWIGPTDAAYDERRALFNAMIDKRPRLIAACKTPADVRSALDRARETASRWRSARPATRSRGSPPTTTAWSSTSAP